MKKHLMILFPLLFLLSALPLFSAGAPENDSWMVPQVNNSFALDADNRKENTGSYIFQLGSTMSNKTCPLTITQKDGNGTVINNGSSDTFYFLMRDNETQKKPFKLYYKLYTVTRAVGQNPSQNNPSFSLYSRPITLKKKTTGLFSYSINTVEFFIDFNAENYNSTTLSPGEYQANLELHYASNDNDSVIAPLTLNASFLIDTQGGSSDLQYSFTVHPSSNSYFIDLKPQSTQTTPIASLSFLEAEVSSNSQTYPNNPFRVVISPINDYTTNIQSSDYFFKKMGADGQSETIYNSIPYTLSTRIMTGSRGSTEDAKAVINAARTKDNQTLLSGTWGSTNKYFNEFRIEADVDITIDPRYSENLSSGVYKATLYYFVVAEK